MEIGHDSQPVRRDVVLRQHVGTHLRVVKRIHEFVASVEADVVVATSQHRAQASSMLDLMQLAAGPGERVSIEARGPDAQRAVSFVVGLLQANHWDAEVSDA